MNKGDGEMKEEEIKKVVRERYAQIAKQSSPCCGPVASCCGSTDLAQDISRSIGYTEEELKVVPDGANLGLGCGNPVALASLREGETVLDLGAGAGFDCFLAADKVGKNGRVIGVDMTQEMLEKARENVEKGLYGNVEFRLGEIENLPVADNSVDVVISNCVINLTPDKGSVFKDTFRVLKPGGRLMVSDIVLLKELPDFVRNSTTAYIGCVAGAILRDEYLEAIKTAGFQEIRVVDEASAKWIGDDAAAQVFIENLEMPPEELKEAASSVVSIKVYAVKPN